MVNRLSLQRFGKPTDHHLDIRGGITYAVSGAVMMVTSGSGLGGTLQGDTLTIKADVEMVYRK